MEKKEELAAYKTALKDYTSKKPVLDKDGNVWNAYDEAAGGEFYGFCWYFLNVQLSIDIKRLTILNSLKPLHKFDMYYWFNLGDKKPRIELLKKAIEILEKELK